VILEVVYHNLNNLFFGLSVHPILKVKIKTQLSWDRIVPPLSGKTAKVKQLLYRPGQALTAPGS